jgi:hypothetical protein
MKACGYKDLQSIPHWVKGLVKLIGARIVRKFCNGRLVNILNLSLYVVKMLCGFIVTLHIAFVL